jgi:hypothetical protein
MRSQTGWYCTSRRLCIGNCLCKAHTLAHHSGSRGLYIGSSEARLYLFRVWAVLGNSKKGNQSMATASADLSTKIIYLFTKFSTSVDNKYMPPNSYWLGYGIEPWLLNFSWCISTTPILCCSSLYFYYKPNLSNFETKKKLCRQMQLTSITFNDYFETYFGSAFEFIDVSVYIRKVRLKTKLK